jgi:hypothetical protein
MGPCIVQYIQQDATVHILFISGNCSTCFGWYFHPSSGAHTTASTASGICHTVTAICHYCGRVGTGLSVLWVAPSCWIYIGILLGAHPILHISRIRVNLGARWGVGDQRHAPAVLSPGYTRCPSYRRLGGPQSPSGRVRKISPPPGFDPRTVQLVRSHCTD